MDNEAIQKWVANSINLTCSVGTNIGSNIDKLQMARRKRAIF
jgi:hypothetical protein